jgi:vitamin B12/bleomycin/antimicrobial peptide transport system ATP-binding/permease protein
MEHLMRKHMRTFLADLWTLMHPYWFSEERWTARALLAAVIGLKLAQVYVLVRVNQWNNTFYNTLQNLDKEGFYTQILWFMVLAASYIVIAVYELYLNQMLQIRWRRWLTHTLLGAWLEDRTYYRLQLTDHGTDNPDQRIADDLAIFCDRTLSLTLGLLSAVVSLVSFVVILWGLSGAFSLSVGGHTFSIPGYMVWFALAYALVGTWLTHAIGRPLVRLNFEQQKFEANFRFALVRFRENAEGIALYHGEAGEMRHLTGRFSDVVRNWWEIMKRQKKLTWFRAGYNQAAVVFPFVVAAPQFFNKTIQLGGLMQTASAFNQVQDALSWFVNAYVQLAEWKATVDRLTSFHNATAQARYAAQHQAGVTVTCAEQADFTAENVHIALPNGKSLLAPVDLILPPRSSVLVTGPSGSGKSTLFRALAGIWPFGRGTIKQPATARVLFLPQKPYLTIGTLRDQLTYPARGDAFTDSVLRQTLRDCGLPQLVDRLEEEQHWAQVLSGGEQQRVAFARALLHQPQWLFMDEATASLDEASEEHLYTLLHTRLPDTSIISIGHRPTLAQFHQRQLRFERDTAGLSHLLIPV